MLNAKAIILAGGSGGLGSNLARWIAKSGGVPVIGCLHDVERANKLAADIKEDHGVSAPVVVGDVLHEETRSRLISAAKKSGELYALVPLIGKPARVTIEEVTEEALLASTRINFVAPILLARDFVASVSGTDTSIVFVSTMQTSGIFPGSAAYAAPKAALVHAARILAKQWGGAKGVRVNVVAPGVTNAGMAQQSIASGKYDKFIENDVIARFGNPEDVTRAIGILLEPDNYITGQVITIDGGLTTRF